MCNIKKTWSSKGLACSLHVCCCKELLDGLVSQLDSALASRSGLHSCNCCPGCCRLLDLLLQLALFMFFGGLPEELDTCKCVVRGGRPPPGVEDWKAATHERAEGALPHANID